MDRVPEGLAEQIEEKIKGVNGVQEVRSLRVRMSGSKAFVDATVGLRRTMPFARAHQIVDDIERTIQAVHPQVDVTVHPEPMQTEDESILDRVRMIVTEKGLPPPHNLEVHRSGGGYFIDFDVEYKKGNTFVEAHAMASRIEEQIRKEIPSVEKVTIHLEEYLADRESPCTQRRTNGRSVVPLKRAYSVIDAFSRAQTSLSSGMSPSITSPSHAGSTVQQRWRKCIRSSLKSKLGSIRPLDKFAGSRCTQSPSSRAEFC